MHAPVDLLGSTPDQLAALAAEGGFSPRQAKNLFRCLHRLPGVTLEDMRGAHAGLRELAARRGVLASLTPQGHAEQPDDGGTRKLLFLTADELPVEAVLMPRQRGGLTLCISSQVGCRVGCTFCRTGEMGLLRNLTAGEIVDQVRWASHLAGEVPRNVVFMGMGEPLENVEAVVAAIQVMRAAEHYAIGVARITISTSGHLPGMRRLAEALPKVDLAVSLNAPNDALRSEIMPINRRYPLADLLAAMDAHPKGSSRTIMVEYVVLAGVNDRPEHARQLRELLLHRPIKLNLIAYNPVPGLPYERPSREGMQAFREAVGSVGKGVIVRYSWGGGIAAACGQLGAEVLEERQGTPAVTPTRPLPWSPLDV
jgi:23S rRNA (adenine2503-C2)-methyltransferase